MTKVFGYARVSTKEQNGDRQTYAIREYCIKHSLKLDDRNLIVDKQSGKDFRREGYQTLRRLLRSGDTLIIKELDRLGRDMEQVKQEWQELTNMGINIIVIDTPILNTQGKTDLEKKLISNIVFELLAYMAEKERVRLLKRQAEGIAQAKAKGKHLGRPRIDLNTLSKKQQDIIKQLYPKWQAGEITAVAFMNTVELKKNTFYKIMKQYADCGLK